MACPHLALAAVGNVVLGVVGLVLGYHLRLRDESRIEEVYRR